MTIIQAYYYLFYKFYILFESFAQTKWQTRSKAVMCVGILEVWFFISIINYWDYFSQLRVSFTTLSILCLIVFIILAFVHWRTFSRKDKWKNYVAEFERWPRKKNGI